MNKTTMILAIIAVIAVVIAGSVSAYVFMQPKQTTETKTIRMVRTALPEVTDLNTYLAKEILKQKYDINLEFEYFEAPEMAMAAMIGGSGDIGSESTGLFSAIARGGAFKVVMAGTRTSDYVIVAKDSITSLLGLEGKTVGVDGELKMGHIYVLYPFEAAGGDPDKVNWLTVGSSGTRVTALLSGQIDATAVHYYQWKYLEAQGGFRMLGTVAQVMPEYTQNWDGCTQSFITDHPDLVGTFVKAQIEANRRFNANFTEFQRMVTENLVEQPDIPLHDLWEFLVSIQIWPNNKTFDTASVQYTIDLLVTTGTLTQNLTVSQCADLTFEANALQALGTV